MWNLILFRNVWVFFLIFVDSWIIAVAVQFLSHVWLFVTPWISVCQAPLSFTVSQILLKFTSIELVMLSNHLILCHPLSLLPSIFLSIRVFSSELALHIRWPEYWSLNFSNSSSNEYSGLLSDQTSQSWYSQISSSTTIWRHKFFGT